MSAKTCYPGVSSQPLHRGPRNLLCRQMRPHSLPVRAASTRTLKRGKDSMGALAHHEQSKIESRAHTQARALHTRALHAHARRAHSHTHTRARGGHISRVTRSIRQLHTGVGSSPPQRNAPHRSSHIPPHPTSHPILNPTQAAPIPTRPTPSPATQASGSGKIFRRDARCQPGCLPPR